MYSENWLERLFCGIEICFHKKLYQKYVDLFLVPSEFVRSELIKAGFPKDKIKVFFSKDGKMKLYFKDLVGDGASKDDIVYTFIPLLHLSNQRKIDLGQEECFGPIEIRKP